MESARYSSKTIKPCSMCSVGLFTWTTWSDDDVINWYINHGVLTQTVECKSCHGSLDLNRNSLGYACGKKFQKYVKTKKIKCTWRYKARVGTWLGKTTLSPKKILAFCVTWLHLRPPRQILFKREFSVSSNAYLNWSSNMKKVVFNHLIRNSVKLGGPGKVIEIEEAVFHEGKNIGEDLAEMKWVLGGVDRKNCKTFLTILPDHEIKTLLSGIIDYVMPGSVIFSDWFLKYLDSAPKEVVESISSNNLEFVGSSSPAYETRAKRRMFDVKECIPQCGRYNLRFGGSLGEYLFKIKYSAAERVHYFFKAAAELYPPIQ